MQKFIGIAIFILLAGRLAAEDIPTIRTYSLLYADPSTTVETLEAMFPTDSSGVRIRAQGRQLVIMALPAQHQSIGDLLKQLDFAPKNVRIEVQFSGSGHTQDREIGIRPKGQVVITGQGAGGRLQLNPSLRSQTTTTAQNTRQTLLAMSGKSARLQVGEQVPYLAWLTDYGHRYGYIHQIQMEWAEIGSFLAVEPTVLGQGPLIRVRVIPEISGRLDDGTPHRVQFMRAATEVVVQDGESVRIGGFDQDKEFSSKFLFGTSLQGGSGSTQIVLTPTIMP